MSDELLQQAVAAINERGKLSIISAPDEIGPVITELSEFLTDMEKHEPSLAKQFLQASGERITIADNKNGVVHFIDGNGLWRQGSGQTEKPKQISLRTFIEAFSGKDSVCPSAGDQNSPSNLVPFLRERITALAKRVLEEEGGNKPVHDINP